MSYPCATHSLHVHKNWLLKNSPIDYLCKFHEVIFTTRIWIFTCIIILLTTLGVLKLKSKASSGSSVCIEQSVITPPSSKLSIRTRNLFQRDLRQLANRQIMSECKKDRYIQYKQQKRLKRITLLPIVGKILGRMLIDKVRNGIDRNR